jgi:hypothetical protein
MEKSKVEVIARIGSAKNNATVSIKSNEPSEIAMIVEAKTPIVIA